MGMPSGTTTQAEMPCTRPDGCWTLEAERRIPQRQRRRDPFSIQVSRSDEATPARSSAAAETRALLGRRTTLVRHRGATLAACHRRSPGHPPTVSGTVKICSFRRRVLHGADGDGRDVHRVGRHPGSPCKCSRRCSAEFDPWEGALAVVEVTGGQYRKAASPMSTTVPRDLATRT